MSITVKVEQGIVGVENVYALSRSEKHCVLVLNCSTKYPQVVATSGGDIILWRSEASLHCRESDAHTVVSIPLPAGWRLNAENCGRYEIFAVIYEPEEETMLWEAPREGRPGDHQK